MEMEYNFKSPRFFTLLKGDGDQECTYCDEHWALYGSVESLFFTPETNITLHANRNLNKNLKKNLRVKS